MGVCFLLSAPDSIPSGCFFRILCSFTFFSVRGRFLVQGLIPLCVQREKKELVYDWDGVFLLPVTSGHSSFMHSVWCGWEVLHAKREPPCEDDFHQTSAQITRYPRNANNLVVHQQFFMQVMESLCFRAQVWLVGIIQYVTWSGVWSDPLIWIWQILWVLSVFGILTIKWEFTVNVLLNQVGGCCFVVLTMATENLFLQSTDGQ